MKKELNDIYQNYKTPDGCGDKGTLHSYIEEYEQLFSPYRSDDINLMEIGIARGDSIVMWSEYFSDKSNIIGVDIRLDRIPSDYHRDNIQYIKADATKEEFLREIEHCKFDIIIDDGDHQLYSQISSFNLLKDKMKSGGIYIIEDIASLDETKDKFIELHYNCEIIDLRDIKGRFDDVLIVYTF